MKKIKLLDDGKIELTVISLCVFIILFLISIAIVMSVPNIKKATLLIIFLTINAISLSVQLYRILYYTILKKIIDKYFSIANKVIKEKNEFDYNVELKKIEEYTKFYRKIFTQNDINLINFTKELVISRISYLNSLQ